MSQTQREQGRWKVHWVVLIIGLLLTYLAFQLDVELENRTIQAKHESISLLTIDALSKELEIHQSILTSIERLFMISPDLSRADFSRFTESHIKALPSIQALEWIPHVIARERESYQLRAATDGLADFNFKERNAQGKMIPASHRAEYYPVYYVEPLKHNLEALGYDLSSSPERMASLLQARHNHQTLATASVSLAQEAEKQKGFLIFQPIYLPASIHTVSRPQQFHGFALGVFRIGDLFELAIAPFKTLLDPLIINVTDITDLSNTELLYNRESSEHLKPLAGKQWHYYKDIQIAGRSWRLSSTATSQFARLYSNQTHWIVLFTGLFFTLLITIYLRNLVNREAQVKHLVKQRSRQFMESETINRTIIDNAVDAVITIDHLGIVSLFSPAAEKMFGYRADEVIGQNINILMPEPYHSEHDGYLKHYQQTGEKKIIGIGREVVGKRKSGDIFPMNLSVGKAKLNDSTLFIGTVTDLTDLKQKEKELQEFSDRLDLAAGAGNIGVWDYDVTGQSLNWDNRMFDLYGISKGQFSQAYDAWHNAVHPDDLERAEAELFDAIQGGKPFDTEFRIRWPNAQIRHIKASGVVLFDDQQQAQRMIGVNQDITQQKLSEQTLLKAQQSAEEASRQKSAFLNTMSHELRTPLTVILGYLPILKSSDQMPPPEVISQIAEDMDLSGNHLLEMINDLLDISKIEAGQMDLHQETIQSQPLITELLRKFDHLAQQKSIQLISNVEDFTIQVDARRLRQIFINLIGNAIKFTQQGSITISAIQHEPMITFSVADTGIGIPQHELPYIFDTFRQVDDSSTRKTGGSGLGLAITKRLVELHGGEIKVESRPGSGTTFSFTIKQGDINSG